MTASFVVVTAFDASSAMGGAYRLRPGAIISVDFEQQGDLLTIETESSYMMFVAERSDLMNCCEKGGSGGM